MEDAMAENMVELGVSSLVVEIEIVFLACTQLTQEL